MFISPWQRGLVNHITRVMLILLMPHCTNVGISHGLLEQLLCRITYVCGPLMSVAASDAILSCYKELAKDSNQPLFGWPADRQVIGLER